MLAPLNTLGVRFEPFLRVVLQGCYWPEADISGDWITIARRIILEHI